MSRAWSSVQFEGGLTCTPTATDCLALRVEDVGDTYIRHVILQYGEGVVFFTHADGGVPLTICACRTESDDAVTVLTKMANGLSDLGCEGDSQRVCILLDALLRRIESTRKERRPMLTSEISDLMEAVDKRRGDIVPCLLGAPGIGKTEGIEEFARTHGRDVVHIIASQILPTEVSGMTMPNQETHSMDVFDHSRLSHMKDGDILFLDELLKGQQQVLSACLTLVQERRLMSGTHLPDVIIVAAANPLASAKMLPEEIRQRFLFIDVEFDKGSWCDYMRKRGVSYPCELTRYLVTKGDSAVWNTMTPRTMTKLALWYRDVKGDPIAETMVERVVRNEFNTDVMTAIKRSLGIEGQKKAKPMDEARDFIRQSMTALPHPANRDEQESRIEVMRELKKDKIDVASLLEKIQKMSGGNAIMEALRNETIDLSITEIGEECDY